MHVLASWEMGRGYGHLGLLANVARHLRALGARITFAARYPDTVLATCHGDFDAVVQAPVCRDAPPSGETLTYASVLQAGGFGSAQGLSRLLASWSSVFDRLQPDVVVAEHAPVSVLAARLAGIPAWRIGSAFIAPSAADAHASLLPWRQISPDALHVAGLPSERAVLEVGSGKVAGITDLLDAAPRIATTWAELDHFASNLPASRYFGDLGGMLVSARATRWPDGPGPRAIAYLPPDRGPGPALVAALEALDWPVLWHWPGARGGRGKRLKFCPDPIDLAEAARGADLFIGRAGHGASAVMLRAGVPQLLIPDTLEALLLAYRLRQAGLAETRPGDLSAAAYAETLRAMSQNGAAQRLRQVVMKYSDYAPASSAERIARLLCGLPMQREVSQ